MTLRSIIVSIILILVAVSLYTYSNFNKVDESKSIIKQYPSFIANNFTTKVFDKDGFLKNKSSTQEVEYYSNKDLILATNSQIYMYDKDSTQKAYSLHADKTSFIVGKSGLLQGNVIIKPLSNDTTFSSITSDDVHINLIENKVYSDKELVIKGTSFENKGQGFVVNLDNKTIEIKGKPHATYQP